MINKLYQMKSIQLEIRNKSNQVNIIRNHE